MWLVVLLAACGAAGWTAPPKPAPPQITTIEGEGFQGRLVAVAKGNASFQVAAQRRSVPLRDLFLIRLGPHKDLMAQPGRKVVVLAGGGMLAGENFSAAEGKILLAGGMARAKIEMSSVSLVYLPGPKDHPDSLAKKYKEIRPGRAAADYLIALDEKGRWVRVSGALKSADAEKIVFQYKKADRTIRTSAVRVIQLARVPGKRPRPIGSLVGRDGSILPFSAIEYDGSKLSVTAEGIADLAVKLSDVAEIRLHSDRGVYLSELEPAKVFQAGMFDVVFPFRKDASTAGGPIRLGGRTYARGLGLHSRCDLTYKLDGKFVAFAALAGIDEAAAAHGSAILKLLGDGKELIKPLKLTGGAKPAPVRCSLAGVKMLKIVVDYGDDGTDVGDHVDLAIARLIKP